MTRINISIPDELHKKLKLEAVKTDRTLKNYIIEVLDKKQRGGASG
ncbi:hypothetical protein ACFL1B_04255 [Nanoarchaeota archaeon]